MDRAERASRYLKTKTSLGILKNNVIFILALQNFRFYVGEYFLEEIETNVYSFQSVKMRQEAGTIEGSKNKIAEIVKDIEYVRMNSPYAIIEVCTNADIDDYVILYMKKFGWKNVRGGTWKDIVLLSPPQQLLPSTSMEVEKCFRCGRTTHLPEDCSEIFDQYGIGLTNRCVRCGEYGHIYPEGKCTPKKRLFSE